VLVLDVLVLPSLLGWLLGVNLSKGWNRAILRRLSAPVSHPVQRAHDFAFGTVGRPSLVLVTYEDGVTIRGYFGPNSLASSDEERSDLYLERLYDVDEASGRWIEPSPGRSGLVSLNRVRSIEFLDEESEQDVG